MPVQSCAWWRVCLTLQSLQVEGAGRSANIEMWCVAHLPYLAAPSGGGCRLQAEYENLWCACLSLESCQVGCAGCSVKYSTVCQVRYCLSGASYTWPSAQSHEVRPAGCKFSSAVAYISAVPLRGVCWYKYNNFCVVCLLQPAQPSSWVCMLHAACKYMRADGAKSPTTIAVAPKPSSQITDSFHCCSPISSLT